MANTLKDLAAGQKLVSNVTLEQSLQDLKSYIDAQDAAQGAAAAHVQRNLDTLIGAQGGDADEILNTFNEIKAFLSDYDESDTLKSLLDAVGTAIGTERSRATGAETALGDRITVLEGLSVLTAAEAHTMFENVFYPQAEQGNENVGE